MRKILDEFKDFAIKGNVVDMSIGIIIGGAFGQIVTSLVNDIVMPPIGLLLGGVDFSDKVWTLKRAAEGVEAVTINYGMFINVVLNFLIVAIAIFIVIKQMNRLRREEPNREKAPAPIPEDIKLLTEIRDALQK